jgi:hypothetical protein
LEALNQRRVRGARSAPPTGARLSNWGSFGLQQARLRRHLRLWKMTYHDLTVKMGESGRVRLKWPGIAARRPAHRTGFTPGPSVPGKHHAAPMTRTGWRCGRSESASKRFRADGSSWIGSFGQLSRARRDVSRRDPIIHTLIDRWFAPISVPGRSVGEGLRVQSFQHPAVTRFIASA